MGLLISLLSFFTCRHTGHNKKHHILIGTALSILNTGIMFYVISFFIFHPVISSTFNMSSVSIHSGLILASWIFSPLSFCTEIIRGILSRRFEYEADRYSVTTYGDGTELALGLKKLSKENMSNLTPHPMIVFLTYSHPPVLSRVREIARVASLGKKKTT